MATYLIRHAFASAFQRIEGVFQPAERFPVLDASCQPPLLKLLALKRTLVPLQHSSYACKGPRQRRTWSLDMSLQMQLDSIAVDLKRNQETWDPLILLQPRQSVQADQPAQVVPLPLGAVGLALQLKVVFIQWTGERLLWRLVTYGWHRSPSRCIPLVPRSTQHMILRGEEALADTVEPTQARES